jgi:hypothetical protein
MKRGALVFSFWAAFIFPCAAQVVAPAQMGVTPLASPEGAYILDNTGRWVEYGTFTGGVFTPVGGGGGGGGVTTCTDEASSTTISAAGCYRATNTGITFTAGTFSTYGLVTIKDGTGAVNPNITIAFNVNGQGNFTETNPYESVDLTFSSPSGIWGLQ